MVFELYLKYPQNGTLKSDHDACLGPWLASDSLHAALNQKSKVSSSIAFVSYKDVECSYTPYSFKLCICRHPMVFELNLKYAQNGILKRDCDACLKL